LKEAAELPSHILVTVITPDVAVGGTTACIVVLEIIVYVVAFTPLNFTAVALANPLPVIVTTVLTGALTGEKEVITAALQLEVTVPFKVKSSSLKLPPVAPVRVNVTVTVPVNPVIGVLTFVWPIDAPTVGAVPFPTLVPLIANAQLGEPALLLCRQKLNEVTSS
jgi:hypothetical protein